MKERVTKIMANIFNIPPENIAEDASSDNIEKWDSLAQIRLIVAIEEEFHVEFDEEQIVRATSKAYLIEILQKGE